METNLIPTHKERPQPSTTGPFDLVLRDDAIWGLGRAKRKKKVICIGKCWVRRAYGLSSGGVAQVRAR